MATIRYPLFDAQPARRKPPSLPPRTFRDRLHPYAGVISFLGLAIVVSTFIVKDVLRENAKDLLETLEGTQNILFIKNAVDYLGDVIPSQGSFVRMSEILHKTNVTFYEFESALIDLRQYVLYWQDTLGNSLASYKLLYERLPEKVRKARKAEKRSVEYIPEQLRLKTSGLFSRLQMAFDTHQALESVTSTEEILSIFSEGYSNGAAEISRKTSSSTRCSNRKLRPPIGICVLLHTSAFTSSTLLAS